VEEDEEDLIRVVEGDKGDLGGVKETVESCGRDSS
jgi:hypothetical protein